MGIRIVLDVRGVRDGMTGVGHYTRLLAGALARERPGDSLVCLALRSAETKRRIPEAAEAPNVEWVEVDADPESHPAGDWWMHRRLPQLLEALEADVYHGPAFVVPRRCPRRAARIATLHDLTVFTFPKAYPLKFRLYLRHAVARSVAAAERVICLTEHGRREAQALFPRESAEKFRVVASAPASIFRPDAPDAETAQDDLPRPYILMVGTFETRKNPAFFLGLYEALQRRFAGANVPTLVWAGGVGHGGHRALGALEPLRRAGLFRLLESLEMNDLSGLYRGATALVYPSKAEGFGLPLVEAMACGAPVLAADASCLPEVVGAGGRILPIDDCAAWADAIERLLCDPAERASAAQRALARASDFSWTLTARRTAEVYEEAIRERARM